MPIALSLSPAGIDSTRKSRLPGSGADPSTRAPGSPAKALKAVRANTVNAAQTISKPRGAFPA